MLFPSFFNAGKPTYEIEQSLRFDSGAYLSRTPSSAGNRKTYSISLWAKKTALDNYLDIFVGRPSGTQQAGVRFVNQSLQFYNQEGASFNIETTLSALSRDPSAWYHIFIAVDTTNATAANRARAWLNGVELATSAKTNPTQNLDTYINTTNVHYIGVNTVSSNPFSGYLAEFNFIDGTALDPTDFGEYDDNGVWRPIQVSGVTYGTNGFYLKFDPSATNGIGHDHSGNGNNFTATGFSTTAGSGYDVMSDTPTTNWATLNPLDKFNGRWSNSPTNGNLEISIPSDSTLKRNYPGAYSTIEVPTTGKFYFEITPSQQYTNIAVVGTDYIQTVTTGDHIGDASQDSVEYRCSSGDYRWSGSTSASGLGGFTSGNVYGVAVDLGDETFRVYENGIAGSELSISGWTGNGARVTAYVSASTASGAIIFNFGQRAFAYTPPTGFKALNTSNLPAPTVKDGSDYFNTVLYNGTGSAQSITGVGFQPDWSWIKARGAASDHRLYDVIRGATKELYSNLTNAEATDAAQITSFDSDGFSVGSGSGVKDSAAGGYVAWNWRASNTSGSSNTDGSITSTVSANPTAGFSIVSYTGNGTAGATVGHGLGVAPSMIITKVRSGTGSWPVYHSTQGAGKYGYLDTTGAFASSTGFYGGVEPTSTVYTIGNNARVNSNGNTYIAYCFAEVEGYSKFGSYTGNSNNDGPFVFCGFKPQWILLKSANGGSWELYDTARDTYNQSEKTLEPNSAAVEGSGYPIDILSNGFKVRTSNSQINYSSYTYIFAAFASSPFGGDGVSPATAR